MAPGSILRLDWVCSGRGQLAGFVLVEVSCRCLLSPPHTGRGCIMQLPRCSSLLLAMAHASLAIADELAAEEKG